MDQRIDAAFGPFDDVIEIDEADDEVNDDNYEVVSAASVPRSRNGFRGGPTVIQHQVGLGYDQRCTDQS